MQKDPLHQLITKPLSSLELAPLRTVAESANVRTAVIALAAESSGIIGITGARNALTGVVTERDILIHALNSTVSLDKRPVRTIMSAGCKSIRPNASVARAVHTMSEEGVRHLIIPFGASSKVISTLDLVRVIYGVIAHASFEPVEGSPERVKRFLESPIEVLKPAVPLIVGPLEPVRAATQLMNQRHAGSMLVGKTGGDLQGIFTERDLLKRVVLADLPSDTTAISAVMTRDPRFVLASASIAHAFGVMHEGGHRHLPLLDREGRLSGVVSVRNFMRGLTDEILADLAA